MENAFANRTKRKCHCLDIYRYYSLADSSLRRSFHAPSRIIGARIRRGGSDSCFGRVREVSFGGVSAVRDEENGTLQSHAGQ
ncbi:hypothetical protein WH47_00289 [Habropoda laboriosa]|uniref:Uncharacterized protein n=1 Tax=Habropoda laboriosa TaxID=597456 RepID=A0A0L7R1W0_9HYME|nr:hypothetical protein WH47_00289 [Habropoda laboriosa]